MAHKGSYVPLQEVTARKGAKNLIDIKDYIGHGKKNAVTRQQLRILTGLGDREIRDSISKARGEGAVILNDQDGEGYYFPTIEEYDRAVACLKTEENRAKCVFWTLKALRRWVRENERTHQT